jgi:transcriptional regulator with XRE-family HTH domain
MDMKNGSFGEYVALVREQHGYSIRQLAAHLGVAPSTISRLEDGSRPLPHPDLVLDLIKNLNLDPVTAVGLLEPYRRLTQACLPNLDSYLRIKYHMKQQDVTQLIRHARQLGYNPK